MTFIKDRKEFVEYVIKVIGENNITISPQNNWLDRVLGIPQPTKYPVFVYYKKIRKFSSFHPTFTGEMEKYNSVRGEFIYRWNYAYESEILEWITGLEKEKQVRDGQLTLLRDCLEKLKHPETKERVNIIL